MLSALAFIHSGCEKNEVTRNGGSTTAANAGNNGHFSDNEHIITEEEAAQLTQRFRAAYPGLNTRVYWTKLAIRKILAQPKVDGTRYYFGQTPDGKPELFFLATDANNDDIIDGDITQSKSAVLLSSRYEETGTGNINWQNSQEISVDDAAASTARHRTKYPNVSLGGSFNKPAIELLLIRNTVFGVFSEHGLTEDGSWVIILRPLDKNGDVIPGMIIEKGFRCPPACGKPNKLNS